jgi:succinate-semialdehyde dehydrogenase / glutarate-semialdehyde dehydrogenase
MFTGINPYTNNVIYEIEANKPNEMENKLVAANNAYKSLKKYTYAQKAQCLLQLADFFAQHKETLAHEITIQMGKAINEAFIEIDKCIKTCHWYAEQGAYMLQEKLVQTEARIAKYTYESSGVLFAIMPWNFPLWQAIRFIIPQILAGNAIVLKHAPNVLLSAQSLLKATESTNLPEGFLQLALINIEDCEKYIADSRITGVTITGSVKAGKAVAMLAGKYIKKSVLELGGSDPFIVLPDANIEKAAAMAVKARFQNAGQTCIAAKRWIVMKPVANDFMEACINLMQKINIGDPLDNNTNMGPLARLDIAENIERQLNESLANGAVKIMGGERNQCSFSPSLITTNNANIAAMKEETFGPLAVIHTVENTEELVALANQTQYGLGASIWTRNELYAMELAKQIEAGNVYINEMVKSHASLPFGGIKQSGYGHELSKHGIQEFMNIKSIWVQ